MNDVVCPAEFAERLDRALAQFFPGLSRTRARQLIAEGAVFVDGRRCRIASRCVRSGNRLRIERQPAAAAITGTVVQILARGNGWIAVNKPANLPSAPTRQAATGTALEILRVQLRGTGRIASRIWQVHRLDAATSGVLLFATTRVAAAYLNAAFRDGKVSKIYVARVAGELAAPRGEITLPLRTSGRRVEVTPQGRPACTHWEVVRQGRSTALLRLRPLTGRTHQLRVHLQAIGHPILGDRLYGGLAAERLMLHAETLIFPEPDSGEPITVHAPAPAPIVDDSDG